jgi:hypothetical protein
MSPEAERALAGRGRLSEPPTADITFERGRRSELEAENARLLRLVGELLVANQRLREQNASAAGLEWSDKQ